ncbi:acyltransferase [Streptomyces sp. NBC_00212]|uniref:acyltransferase family protein n=1 Tax=Streptomyces sp. NBC_00212 TaxID=2975684 RepID=UPI002F90C19F
MPQTEGVNKSGRPDGNRLPSLTGLRFAAALLVFATHIAANRLFADAGTNDLLTTLFGRAGWLAVSFFFILSGFILTWSARPDTSTRGFWRRRIAKIYPVHLVTLIVALALMAASGQALKPFAVAANTVLASTWFPVLDVYDSPNGLSWSLCCEVVFYLAFPLLHRAVKRIPGTWLWACVLATAAAIAAVSALALLLPTDLATPWAAEIPFWQYWLVYSLPPVRMLEFVLGILLARIVLTGRWIGLERGPARLLVLAAYVLVIVVPVNFAMTAVAALPLGLLVAATAVADARGSRSVFRARTLVWLGEVSFAFYMIHELVIRYGLRWLGHPWAPVPAAVLVAAFFAAALACAAALHRFVEVPAMRRFGRSRQRPVAAAPEEQPRPTALR